MAIVAETTRINVGPEFIPTCDPADAMNKVVQPGEVWVPEADSIWDCVYVKGTLRVDRTRDTVLRAQTIVVDPNGGVLEIGTAAAPIPPDRKVEILIRDVPINTTDSTKWNYDPYQWGNGVVNFGTQTRVGAVKTPFVIIEDAQAGATTLTLAAAASGWRVGDELLPMDTQKPASELTRPRREAPVTIAAIDGQAVTLSKPLDFAHLTDLTADGKVAVRPIVANLTRNIVLRSENVAGTPGHSVNIGDAAKWNLTANQFVGLGRTTVAVINNTTLGGSGDHVGLNQIGKYASHNHHAGLLTPGSQDVDNVMIAGRGKWGHSQHATHDMLFRDNIAVGFQGAGFVTEDGYEVRNKFYHNLAAYIIPPDLGTPFSSQNVTEGRPGVEGAGFWWRSVMNDYQDNQAWDSVVGLNLFAQQQVSGLYPSVPGGPANTVPPPREQPSIAIQRNSAIGNMLHGLEVWGVVTPVEDLVAVNTAGVSYEVSQSNATQIPVLRRPLISTHAFDTDDARYPIAVGANSGYVPTLEFSDGYIGGHAKAMFSGGAITYVHLTNMVMQNAIDADFSDRTPREYAEVNVIHKPLPPHAPQYLIFGPGTVWPGGPTPPQSFIDGWLPQAGNRFTAKNWQGTGKDYRFFEFQQRAATAAWPSNAEFPYQCPESGITMGACWAKYGLAYRGDTIAQADEVPLVGLGNAVAGLGLATVFRPPWAIVTFPMDGTPAIVSNGQIAATGVLTGGTVSGVSDTMRVSVDGGATFDLNQRDGFRQTHRPFTLSGAAAANGSHTIRTWRTTSAGETIPASLMTFKYQVGTTPPPVQTFALTVVSGTGSGSFAAGAVVPIAANAPPVGQVFAAWTGAAVADASSPSTTLTMPGAATTVTATYRPETPPQPTLTLPLTVTVCDSSAPPKCQVYVPKP